MAQIATGVGTTSMWIPDIGDEVIVAFEHGDPHRPVVIGSLYNANSPPPVQLPNNKTQTLFRSTSIPAGTIPLELFMEAKTGQEHLTLRVGNQFLRLNPNGITASSVINVPAPAKPRLQSPTRPKSPIRPLEPKR